MPLKGTSSDAGAVSAADPCLAWFSASAGEGGSLDPRNSGELKGEALAFACLPRLPPLPAMSCSSLWLGSGNQRPLHGPTLMSWQGLGSQSLRG